MMWGVRMREVGWDKWWAFYGYVMMSVNGSIAAGDDAGATADAQRVMLPVFSFSSLRLTLDNFAPEMSSCHLENHVLVCLLVENNLKTISLLVCSRYLSHCTISSCTCTF